MTKTRVAVFIACTAFVILGGLYLTQPNPTMWFNQVITVEQNPGYTETHATWTFDDPAALLLELETWRPKWPVGPPHTKSLSDRAANGRPATWSYPESVCTSHGSCDTLLEHLPCPNGPAPATGLHDPRFTQLALSTCSYRRIASCFPKDLQECFSRRLNRSRWLIVLGDSVTRNTFHEFFTHQMPQDQQKRLLLSAERVGGFVPFKRYYNQDFLVFGKFLVTIRFIGTSGGQQTIDNIVAGMSLSDSERQNLFFELDAESQARNESLIPEAKRDSLFRKPDVVVINAGLWDTRVMPPSYFNYSMTWWQEVFQEMLGFEPQQLYWRNINPVSTMLPHVDRTRQCMTNERIAELNWIAHNLLIRQGGWHSIDAFTAIGGFVPPAEALSQDYYHPSTLELCKVNDMVFGTICDVEASPQ
ncbi:hypothetical protein CAOG_05259 [Capsaspora owczarzaki ATCC 30864]|uniref:Uncharacterized protein n=1 Tax=Capsaspora owczarzaki (strain ATCC 30864) TaxID=595528 RepID=A0A0D2VTP0_CAPO3|nr:hypothetical protein CAOG_05259 [Capsaspora owczarzaki ATCC 30864]KJE94642.1 hypothetical protein CAOG_005259 [Capsaspora owczarzaki ATCC 30864]|eukprot:XP_004346944.1 hypothetical protein CAOG_05259 [Capsaspora owczarzaki ATCC 30864]